MKKHRGDGFIIIEDKITIQLMWPVGPYGESVSYPITKENMEKALKSKEDAYEVMVFAETGKWPPTKEEKLEKDKEFIREFPELLSKVAENEKLFEEEELKNLLEKEGKDE